MLHWLNTLDHELTLAVNILHTPFTDAMWLAFSDRQIWYVLYLIIAGIVIWRVGWKKGLIMILAVVICIVAVDQGCNLVKHSAERLRPCWDEWMISHGLNILEKPSERSLYGFFSGHSANSFAFATWSLIALRLDKRLKWKGYAAFIYTWAALVAISRIFVGKHFLGDIIVGAIFGIVVAQGICALARLLINKLNIK